MMAPTLVIGRRGGVTALGSGGSNRIRSAILQVLVNRLAFRLPLDRAVNAPRLHMEGDFLDVEAGPPDAAIAAAVAEAAGHKLWPAHNLFFGGVNAVHADADGTMTGLGDPRRGGAAVGV